MKTATRFDWYWGVKTVKIVECPDCGREHDDDRFCQCKDEYIPEGSV